MGRYNAPLPKEITDAIFASWLSVLKRRESGCVPTIPCSNRQYRIDQCITEQTKLFPDCQFIPVVFGSFQSERWEVIQDKLEAMRKKEKKQTIFFVVDGEWVLQTMPHVFSGVHQYLIQTKRSVSFLWFIESNILSPSFSSIIDACPSLIQNIFPDPMYEDGDVYHFIRHLEGLYGFSLKEISRKSIVEACGGFLWFVAEAVRHAHATGKLSLSHDTMKFRVERLWNGFTHDEQSVLTALALGNAIDPSKKNIGTYFRSLRLTTIDEGKESLRILLLRDYILKKIEKENRLVIGAKNTILYNDVSVSSHFSRRERAALVVLLTHSGQIVSRDELARAFWGAEDESKYSDWAIDQIIRRLRIKCVTLGLPTSMIKTVKGKGVYVQGS